MEKRQETILRFIVLAVFTYEVRVSNKNTERRRIRFGELDGFGLMMAKIGNGSNLLRDICLSKVLIPDEDCGEAKLSLGEKIVYANFHRRHLQLPY